MCWRCRWANACLPKCSGWLYHMWYRRDLDLWPFWPKNLTSSSLTTTAPKMETSWKSHKRFVRYCVYKLLLYDHARTDSPKTGRLRHRSNSGGGTTSAYGKHACGLKFAYMKRWIHASGNGRYSQFLPTSVTFSLLPDHLAIRGIAVTLTFDLSDLKI